MLKHTISSKELSELTGMTDRWHRRIAALGYYPQPRNGQYDFPKTVSGLLRFYREKAQTADLRSDKLRADTVRSQEEAAMTKVERLQKEARLLDADLVERKIADVLLPIRERLIGMPSTLAAQCNPADPRLAFQALDRWVRSGWKELREGYTKTQAAAEVKS